MFTNFNVHSFVKQNSSPVFEGSKTPRAYISDQYLLMDILNDALSPTENQHKGYFWTVCKLFAKIECTTVYRLLLPQKLTVVHCIKSTSVDSRFHLKGGYVCFVILEEDIEPGCTAKRKKKPR